MELVAIIAIVVAKLLNTRLLKVGTRWLIELLIELRLLDVVLRAFAGPRRRSVRGASGHALAFSIASVNHNAEGLRFGRGVGPSNDYLSKKE